MALNGGYSYREQLGTGALEHTALSYLVARYTHSSRAVWERRLAAGEVYLDGVAAQGDERLRPGQLLVWHRPPREEEAVPRHYTVVFEDDAILALNKPSGLPTVPAGGLFTEHAAVADPRDLS